MCNVPVNRYPVPLRKEGSSLTNCLYAAYGRYARGPIYSATTREIAAGLGVGVLGSAICYLKCRSLRFGELGPFTDVLILGPKALIVAKDSLASGIIQLSLIEMGM